MSVPEAMHVYTYLQNVVAHRGGGFIVLIDPENFPPEALPSLAARCEEAGVDAFFIGGSLVHDLNLNAYVLRLKESTTLPVIGFPGSITQICRSLDALLYLSVISSNNPEYLFRQHIQVAPIIRKLNIEPIATGYMLIESGRLTTAQYMSASLPLPRHKPDVAAATAMAAEMMGMKLLFTDAGSGAEHTVPETLIQAITQVCSIPLVVGGGIRSPEEVARKMEAGASFVVVGNAIEKHPDPGFISELAAAAHVALPRPIEGSSRQRG